MKAVRFAMVLMFFVLLAVPVTWSEESSDLSTENGEAFAESAVKPYEGFLDAKDSVSDQIDTLAADKSADVDSMGELAVETVSDSVNDAATETKEVATDQSQNSTDSPLMEAVKAEIKDRSKATGRLDLYDGTINKVRTLDLMEYKSDTTQDGDATVVRADFRDTSSGDVVTLDIKVLTDNGKYSIKDLTIASVTQPKVKEAKTEYSDEEIKSFMLEYVDTQSQATGTFDLYDEKSGKMRNLQLVNVDEKLRRYGIIAIATAEFTDKNTGDVVKVDVNTENKNGLSVTAMRIKSVSKPVAKE